MTATPAPLPAEEISVTDLREALKDAARRAREAVHLEAKNVLSRDVYPLLDMMIVKLGQMEEALFAVFEGEELIAPDTAAVIMAALSADAQLRAAVERALPVIADPALVDELRSLSQVAAQACASAETAVAGLIEETDDEDDEEEGEGDGE